MELRIKLRPTSINMVGSEVKRCLMSIVSLWPSHSYVHTHAHYTHTHAHHTHAHDTTDIHMYTTHTHVHHTHTYAYAKSKINLKKKTVIKGDHQAWRQGWESVYGRLHQIKYFLFK